MMKINKVRDKNHNQSSLNFHNKVRGLLMKKILGKKFFQLLKEIGQVAQSEGLTVYLVGGPVRDLLLGMHQNSAPSHQKVQGAYRSKDLDIVVSTGRETTKNTAINLAKELLRIWKKKKKK